MPLAGKPGLSQPTARLLLLQNTAAAGGAVATAPLPMSRGDAAESSELHLEYFFQPRPLKDA